MQLRNVKNLSLGDDIYNNSDDDDDENSVGVNLMIVVISKIYSPRGYRNNTTKI